MGLEMSTTSGDGLRKHLLQTAQLRRTQDRCRVLDDPRICLLIDVELAGANGIERLTGPRSVLQLSTIGCVLAVATLLFGRDRGDQILLGDPTTISDA